MWGVLGRKPRASEAAGKALYAAAVEQARRPVFYTGLGVADSANGRFELYSLHVILLLRRLKAGGPAAGETAQALFDVYISELDQALREQGVGDLSMAKTMRKLGEAFYGRVRSYDEAFDALPDVQPLRLLLLRTLGEEGGDADGLTRYASLALDRLAAEGDAALLQGEAVWPEVRP
ncbi:MAG: ubiquinol-cytochrome C reductase [Proteobacteria bacterium]|nr:ubiquinol-cytochrome C reductase [Pseudomonadota bacterium]MBW3617551.1 ubiquinol-cytochrome C reductase [Pseudomonadota bacterium]